MANRNIQMKKKNGDTWDNLYPVTKITNVLDLAGKIISESGSNSNGYYVRFADGTQICWHTKYTTNLIDTPHGNVYYSGSDIWTFPASFKIPPKFFQMLNLQRAILGQVLELMLLVRHQLVLLCLAQLNLTQMHS